MALEMIGDSPMESFVTGKLAADDLNVRTFAVFAVELEERQNDVGALSA